MRGDGKLRETVGNARNDLPAKRRPPSVADPLIQKAKYFAFCSSGSLALTTASSKHYIPFDARGEKE